MWACSERRLTDQQNADRQQGVVQMSYAHIVNLE